MIGIDTNVLVYLLTKADEKKHEISLKIFEDILTNPEYYVLSNQVLAELNYVAVKKIPEVKPLVRELTASIVGAGVKIVSYNYTDILSALNERKFWDALIYFTYKRAGATHILTENTKDFPESEGIELLNPFEDT